MKRQYKYLSDEQIQERKDRHDKEICNLIEKIEERYGIEINQDDIENLTSLVLRKKWWIDLHNESNIRLLEKSFTFRLRRMLYVSFMKKKISDIKNYFTYKLKKIFI
jgi:hypothetical protein